MTLAESNQGFRLRVLRTTRHVEADIPGELLSLDTFYVGRRKGVGTVWHIAGCDVASSHTWAQLVIGEVTAEDTWRFLDAHETAARLDERLCRTRPEDDFA